jgi:hypothetical protein
MKELLLTQSKVAFIDDEDFERVNKYKWRYAKSKKWNSAYAYGYNTFQHADNQNRRTLPLHRFILGLSPDDKRVVDHIDGNGLNNLRANLRIATRSQNMANSKVRSSSTYKGVYSLKDRKAFKATITKNRISTHLGYFPTAIEAARAYDQKAKELFGEFAALNFPT